MKVDISNLTGSINLPILFSTDFLLPSNYNLTVDKINVSVSGNILRQGDIFVLQADCKTVLYFNCDSCLTPISYDLSFVVEELFTNEVIDDLTVLDEEKWQFSGKIIDIKEAIHTNLIMNMPIQTLCSDDCKGLCFKCGKNLNESDCECDRALIDPRFEGLYSLFNNEEEKK